MILRRKEFIYPGEYYDILKTLFTRHFNGEEYIKEFEFLFRQYTDQTYAIPTFSGCHALEILLEFYNFKKNPNKTLIVPSFTAKVVELTLKKLDIKYVLVDINPRTSTVCIKSLESLLSGKKKYDGILLTHLLGNICSQDVINILQRNKLLIIEDCAHAIGAIRNGIHVGSYGDAAFYSFGTIKLINTFGGGMITTKNEDLFNFCNLSIINNKNISRRMFVFKLLFGHIGILFSYFPFNYIFKLLSKKESTILALKRITSNIFRGGIERNEYYKFSNIQALIGLKQLKQIDFTLNKRQRIVDTITSHCNKNLFLEQEIGSVPYNLIFISPKAGHTKQILRKNNIDAGTGNSIMEPLGIIKKNSGLKEALDSYVQLPLYNDLKLDEINKIIKTLTNKS